MYQGTNGSTEHCKGNKTVPKTVATTRTEDGHRQNTKTNTAIQTEREKEHRAIEEEMEGPTSSGGSSNRPTRLNLHEHDVNGDDDDIHLVIFNLDLTHHIIKVSPTKPVQCSDQ
jgi:hypothetical protein